MLKDLAFNTSFNQLFCALVDQKYLNKKNPLMDSLPMEAKYLLVRLSALGVVTFTPERILLAEGMESWVRIYWEELSQAA